MQKKYLFSTNFQWQVIESLLVCKRKSKWELRRVWEAICYVTKTGCQWRLVPVSYPPWQTIYWYFRKWTLEGVIEIAHQCIRRAIRKAKGKNESASVGIIDSASARMSSISGHERGIDGNKKIKSSKRHIITDTMGLLICLSIHAANIHDSKGARGEQKVFEKDFLAYKTSGKGTIQFPLEKPMPLNLITKIVKFRVKENLEKTKTRLPKKTTHR